MYQQQREEYEDASDSSSSSSSIGVSNEYLTDIHLNSTAKGPLHTDPLYYTEMLFSLLSFYVLYLLLPRGYRVMYCGAYPKRYIWSSSRTYDKRRHFHHQFSHHHPMTIDEEASFMSTPSASAPHHKGITKPSPYRPLQAQGIPSQQPNNDPYTHESTNNNNNNNNSNNKMQQQQTSMNSSVVSSLTSPTMATSTNNTNTKPAFRETYNTPLNSAARMYHPTPASVVTTVSDEIAISATMQELRDAGVLIVAHGSKGKPKSVRLQLTETAITWRTETKKKKEEKTRIKQGKLHQVPLSHIIYVNVGKQTTALRRVENASVSETVCFSLLTKDGSLDLECMSVLQRDALVNCFSMVLDEIHAQGGNWRDVYRAPSSDMPSSFDEYDIPPNNEHAKSA